MAIGDPVPGAELYIEHEPNPKPIAKGETDGKGEVALTLGPGRYAIRVELDEAQTRAIAAVDLQVRAPGLDRAKTSTLAYYPGRRSSASLRIETERKTELRVALREVQARHPAAAALRAGLVGRELELDEGEVWIDALVDVLVASFGAPVDVEDPVSEASWPPPHSLTSIVTFTIPSPDGLLIIRIHVRAWTEQGQLHVGVGPLHATQLDAIPELASSVVRAILNTLETLDAPPMGVELQVRSTRAAGSKGGFAVGGFSPL